MHRTFLIICTAAMLPVGIGACHSAVPQSSTQSAAPSRAPAAAAASAGTPAAGHDSPRTASVRELTEPQAGMGPLYRLITGAHSSVDLTMYELADPTAEADLAADASRGVNVRVILDRHLEKAANTAAYEYLAAHRVHAQWAPSGTTYHQKTLTVDGTTSVIMTFNLVARDYPGTRDFGVIDTNRADVAAIVATFNADFTGRPVVPPDGTDLVWSPSNAETSILSVIAAARHTLAVEDEEMDDPAVASALAAAARRGVQVTITMTADPSWDQAFTVLARVGAHIRLYADNSATLYIHAKAIVADAGPASGCWSARRTSPPPASATTASLASSPATRPSSRPSAPRSPPITPEAGPTPRPPGPSRPGHRRQVPGAAPPQASITPVSTRTMSSSIPTSPTRTQPRRPTATPAPTRPTAPATP